MSKNRKAAPPALDVAKVRAVLGILADGAPVAQVWPQLEAEHGAQISEGGSVSIHGVETRPAVSLDDALRLWGNKARRALLAAGAA